MATKKQKANSEDYNFSILDIELFHDNVLVKALRPKDKNGLINPAQYEDKPEWGMVMGVGGKVESNISIGDVVRFGKYSTECIRSNGEDFYIVRQEDISGKVVQ